MTDGLVVVDKPAGWTSHDVVARLRRVFGIKRIGHAGTLDPDATGVLLVGIGRATRLLRFLQEAGKVYRGDVGFGISTSTLDAAGEVLEREAMPMLTRAEVEAAVGAFVGDIEQVPPMVSAIKIGGRRLHELARRGEEVDRPPRRVHIDRIDVEAFEAGEFPRATLRVECGSGTYIRSLAADVGAAVGGRAHLLCLRRLQAGPFGVEEARSLEEIEAAPEEAVLPPLEAVRHLERVDVDGETARGVGHGAVFATGIPASADSGGPAASASSGGPGAPIAVVGPEGTLLALYERRGAGARPVVVMQGA